jgi:hypothetical protein
MENETSKTRSLKTAFLLDPESLRRLQALLAEADGATEYRVKFDDGSTVKYDLVDEVIGQPNAGKKFIVGLITSAGGQGRSISLTMRGDPEPSVEYTMSGVQRDVVYFSDKLDDWIASCTQWYSLFYTSSLGILLALGLIALPIFSAGRVAAVFSPKGNDWHSYLSGATLVAVSFAEYWALKLFPSATFASDTERGEINCSA